jgi:sulfide dehydrogenase cytochrome subunit
VRRLPAVLILCIVWLGTGAQAAPSAVTMSIACGGCHGTLGVSAGLSMPSLAGQSKEYFISAMKKYRSGERPSTVMGRLAKGYSDAEIEAMAAFYARMKPSPAKEAADARLAEKGRAVFYKQCKVCHLDRGPLWRQIHRNRDFDGTCRHCHADYGNDGAETTPFIASQWPRYLVLQLEEFKDGRRPMSRTKASRLKSLSEEDIEAVASFYASQPIE